MALSNDSILVTPGTGATLSTHLAGGKEHEVVILANSLGSLQGTDTNITISVSGSIANQVAATWSLKKQWPIPTGAIFRPAYCWSAVTTAASRTLITNGLLLGTFNVSTNAFTDGSSVLSPRHYGRMFAVVTTAMSATANTVTVTYTNQAGTAGRTTAALSIPASSPVGTAFEFVLATTTGIMVDAGVRDVTAVSDTAAPTGVLEIWGMNPLHDTLGIANAWETSINNGQCGINDSETVFILFNQSAVTAQQRSAGIIGTISA